MSQLTETIKGNERAAGCTVRHLVQVNVGVRHIRIFLPFSFLIILGSIFPAFALQFSFTYDSSIPADKLPLIQPAMERAAEYWTESLTDDVTLNITVKWSASLNPGEGARASVLYMQYSYAKVYAALQENQVSSLDEQSFQHLNSEQVAMLINRTSNNPHGNGSATPYIDANQDANNTMMRVCLANAKALGLLPGDFSFKDGTITVNSTVNWDGDDTDGISPGKADLTKVLAHELGHCLGFSSLIESQLAYNPGQADSSYTVVSPFDLFRFSAESISEGGLGTIDWTSDARDKYFSLDGGATCLGLFSTGKNGDGPDPSHWKHLPNNDPSIGIMDPYVSPKHPFRSTDVKLLDAIGWDATEESITADDPSNEPSGHVITGPQEDAQITRTIITSTYIEIQWSEVQGATSYKVQSCDDMAKGFVEDTSGFYGQNSWRRYFTAGSDSAVVIFRVVPR